MRKLLRKATNFPRRILQFLRDEFSAKLFSVTSLLPNATGAGATSTLHAGNAIQLINLSQDFQPIFLNSKQH